MSTVKISPKFQVVIPREIREPMRLRAGERLQIFRHRNRIELIPVPDVKSLRGFAKGIDTSVPRDKDRV